MHEIEKNAKAVNECYRMLYKQSIPSANFDELIKNAPTNALGQKEIDYMSYEIDIDTYQNIVDKMIKKHRFVGIKKQLFKNTIALGCSPKFKS